MLIKLTGAAIVFCSCTAAGLFLSTNDKFRAEELNEMKRGLIMLKSKTLFSDKPLYEAMLETGSELNASASEIFEDAGRLLKSKKAESVSEAWDKTLHDRKRRSFFTSDDLNALSGIGNTMGSEDKKCQLSGIDMAVEYIDSKSAELMKRYAGNSRLYRSAGMLFGILIVVVLF